MLYKEKYKVKYIITEFLFNILNRENLPPDLSKTENCLKIHKGQRATFVLIFTWNIVRV